MPTGIFFQLFNTESMPQFAVLHIEKGGSSCFALGQHIDRSKMPANADPSRKHENKIIVDHGYNLNKAIQERISEGYKGKRVIRKDAVKSLSLVMTGSHEQMKNLEESGKLGDWVKANQKYLSEKYGEKNIVSLALHMDERTPHLHAVVVPLTHDGRLSAKEVVGNREDLRLQQTEYGKRMEKFGLSRGLENSPAHHEDVKEYYARLKNPVDKQISLPKRGFLESQTNYDEKLKKALKPLALAAIQRNDLLKYVKEEQEQTKRERIKHEQQFDSMKRFLDRTTNSAKRQSKEAKEELEKIKKDILSINNPDDLKKVQNILLNKEKGQRKDRGIGR